MKGSKYFPVPAIEIPLKENMKFIPKKVPVFEVGFLKDRLMLLKVRFFGQGAASAG